MGVEIVCDCRPMECDARLCAVLSLTLTLNPGLSVLYVFSERGSTANEADSSL